MDLNDIIVLDAVRKTSDGYLAASAKVARTGIQLYRGAEVGRPDLDVVRVYRPADEVFAKDALATFAWRPVTSGHPAEPVTADNWRTHAIGQTGDEVARDGEFVRVPLVLMDGAVIKDVEGGRRQLSMGYSAELTWGDGTTDAGETYDAVQTKIRANHLAVVAAARGGPELRIGDNEGDRHMTDKTLKTITVDGLSVEVTDTAAQVVQKTIANLDKKVSDADAAMAAKDAEIKRLTDAAAATAADHKKAIDAKDGELAGVKKELEDAKAAMAPAKLDAMVKDRAAVVDKAKKLVGDKLVTDGKTDADIRRQAVAAKLGDAAVKDRSDDYVQAAFDTLVGTGAGTGGDRLAAALSDNRPPANAVEARDQAYDGYTKELGEAWRTAGRPAAAA